MLRTLLLAVVMVLSAVELSAAKVPYVEYSSSYKTLEFFYGDEDKLNQTNTWKVLPSSRDYVGVLGDTSRRWEYFPWYQFRDEVETVVFDDSFNDYKDLADTDYMFYGFTALKTVKKLWNIKLSVRGASMMHMFEGCTSLTDASIGGLRLNSGAGMSSMFEGCYKLTSLDLTSFNTAKVTNMDGMFYMADSGALLTTVYATGKFSTAALEKPSETMFRGCTALKGAVAFDAGKLDASMANYATGYFTVPYKLGGTPHPLTVAEDGTLTCGRLVLDGENEATRNFTAYEPFTATEGAEYSRMLPYATYWGSVCLPFAFNTADCSSHTTATGISGPYIGTFTFYDISSLNDAKDVLTLTKVEGAVEAGRPLLYHTDRNLQQLMTIKTPNAPTAVVTAPVDGQVRSGIYLTGTFTDCQMPDEAYALGSGGLIVGEGVSKLKCAA